MWSISLSGLQICGKWRTIGERVKKARAMWCLGIFGKWRYVCTKVRCTRVTSQDTSNHHLRDANESQSSHNGSHLKDLIIHLATFLQQLVPGWRISKLRKAYRTARCLVNSHIGSAWFSRISAFLDEAYSDDESMENGVLLTVIRSMLSSGLVFA